MWECDLHTTAPLIDEAKSRQDLAKVLARLRTERKWAKEGWTRRKILEGVDDTFIHHREHAERMMSGGDGFPAAKGIKKVTFRADENRAELVIDGSREWENKPHTYRTSIRFSNYGLIRALPETTWPERARLLMEDNVRVDCTCDAFRYFYRYKATRAGFALVYEHRPASKRNPGRRGTVCKHLEHALRYIGTQYAVVASAMKRHHVEETMTVAARITQVLGESQEPAPAAPSRAQFEGGLHEAVREFGILDAINGLFSEASKRGMGKTAEALRMAAGMAGIEGATITATPKPDARILDAPAN